MYNQYQFKNHPNGLLTSCETCAMVNDKSGIVIGAIDGAAIRVEQNSSLVVNWSGRHDSQASALDRSALQCHVRRVACKNSALSDGVFSTTLNIQGLDAACTRNRSLLCTPFTNAVREKSAIRILSCMHLYENMFKSYRGRGHAG